MRANFHLKTLTVAVAALSIASVASAAGLDRSGQDITAFLQDGTYAESVYTYIDADVSGKDLSGNKLNDIGESYDFFRYGVKADLNDTFSIGILYDEPFGAAADYNGQNDFVTDSDRDAIIQDITKIPNVTEAYVDNVLIPQLQGALAPGNPGGLTADQLKEAQGKLIGLEAAKGLAAVAGEATQVEVRTESITGILGAKFGANKEFQAYGGPVAQRQPPVEKARYRL